MSETISLQTQSKHQNIQAKMQESELETTIDCRTIFDPLKSEKTTGYNIFPNLLNCNISLITVCIYDEKIHLRNYGEKIEIAIPTSLKPKRTQTLVWVRAGHREWTTKAQPNQVFYLFLNV